MAELTPPPIEPEGPGADRAARARETDPSVMAGLSPRK